MIKEVDIFLQIFSVASTLYLFEIILNIWSLKFIILNI